MKNINKWAEIKQWVESQKDRSIELLEVNKVGGAKAAELFKAAETTYMGAYLRSCGGILVANAKIRLLGCPAENKYRNIISWNDECGMGIITGMLLIADDVFGNFYCINLGGIKEVKVGDVCALYADEVNWIGIDTSFIDFVSWLISGDLKLVFGDFPIEDREIFSNSRDIANIVFNYYPPLYTIEGNINQSSRRLVPVKEGFLIKKMMLSL